MGRSEPPRRALRTGGVTASALQSDLPDAVSALEAAEQSTVDGAPLIRAYKDVADRARAAVADLRR